MAIREVVIKLVPGTTGRQALDDIKIILWSLGFEAVENEGQVTISATDMAKLQTRTVKLGFSEMKS